MLKKAGTGQHNELANPGSLPVCGNTEKQSAMGPNNAGHTHRAGNSLLRSTGYEKMFGNSGLLSAEQDFPAEHCSQKWKCTVASATKQ